MSLFYTLPEVIVATGTIVAVDEGVRDLWGYDIYFREDFLLTNAGDYTRITKEDNLRTSIYRRLLTRPGYYKFRPEYGAGVQTYVKKTQSKANLDSLRQRIIDQVSLDPRVQKVDVVVEPGTINNTAILKVFMKVVAFGKNLQFEPFTFAEAAA